MSPVTSSVCSVIMRIGRGRVQYRMDWMCVGRYVAEVNFMLAEHLHLCGCLYVLILCHDAPTTNFCEHGIGFLREGLNSKQARCPVLVLVGRKLLRLAIFFNGCKFRCVKTILTMMTNRLALLWQIWQFSDYKLEKCRKVIVCGIANWSNDDYFSVI